MNNNTPDPHQRKGAPLFSARTLAEAEDKTVPYPGNPKTLPFGMPNNPMGVSEDAVTLPMPGAGRTVPLVPSAGRYDAPVKSALGPVAGWLVVIAGPGRGRSLEVGYGYNSIGRGYKNEIVLNFDDDAISDEGHAYIAYDNVGHKSYVTHGHSRNMIYLDNAPVLGTVEIHKNSVLRIGNTLLMFVPFCSADMNWASFPETVD